ncbi:MAG TPA: hypothetical protein VD866_16710 [Urbifossiella sp.]|nr:hypothetical protein [Urbifossiella sp.]
MDTTVTLPASVRRLMEARTRQWADEEKDNARRNLTYHSDAVKATTERLLKAEETAKEKVAKWAEAIAALKSAGFKPRTQTYSLDITLDVREKRLSDVARAVGHLDPNTIDKDIVDAGKKLVRISHSLARYPFVTVRYVRRLTDEDRCRIVATDVPARVELSLVCER